MKTNKILLYLSMLLSLKAFAMNDLNYFITIDNETHPVPVGSSYGEGIYIVDKATFDGINYYSVPFKCDFYTKYTGENGMVYGYDAYQLNLPWTDGIIKASETKSFEVGKVIVKTRQMPYVEFYNDACSSLYDGDLCINALKAGKEQPYIYITCHYTE